MSLDIGDALSEGLDRTFASPTGRLLVAIFVVFQLLNAVVQQSRNRKRFDVEYFNEFLSTVEGIPYTAEELRRLVEQAMPLGYLDGWSLTALFLLGLVFAVLAEAIRIVSVRTFVNEGTETIPREYVRRHIGWVTFNGLIGGIVTAILVVLGLFLFVVPGLFLLVSFFFVRQEVASEDVNFVDAMANSWELAKGNRLAIFGLEALIFLLFLVPFFVAGTFAVVSLGVASIAYVVVTGVVLVLGIAINSRAYDQLKTEQQDREDIEEYMDEDLDPI